MRYPVVKKWLYYLLVIPIWINFCDPDPERNDRQSPDHWALLEPPSPPHPLGLKFVFPSGEQFTGLSLTAYNSWIYQQNELHSWYIYWTEFCAGVYFISINETDFNYNCILGFYLTIKGYYMILYTSFVGFFDKHV